MNTCKRHQLPVDIISYAVWLYYCFDLSHCDIEDLLVEHGITVSREAVDVFLRAKRDASRKEYRHLQNQKGWDRVAVDLPE